MLNNIFFYMAVFDAMLCMAAGSYAAALYLFNKKDELNMVWERLFPALVAIIGTSLAAGAILGAAKWAFGMPV